MRLISSTSWEGIFTYIRNLFHTFMFYIFKSTYLYCSRVFLKNNYFFTINTHWFCKKKKLIVTRWECKAHYIDCYLYDWLHSSEGIVVIVRGYHCFVLRCGSTTCLGCFVRGSPCSIVTQWIHIYVYSFQIVWKFFRNSQFTSISFEATYTSKCLLRFPFQE